MDTTHKTPINYNIINLCARIILAVIFCVSSVMKMMNFTDTVIAVLGYEIVGISLAHYVAIGIIIMEIMLFLWAASGKNMRLFYQVSIIVFIFFIGIVASAWARGLSINCGCFGSSDVPDNPVMGYIITILRDVVFIVVASLGLHAATRAENDK